jgi:phosphatidate cytidylyltransferase
MKMMSDLRTRTLTAVVFAFIVLGSIFSSHISFFLLFLFISVACLWEFIEMMKPQFVYSASQFIRTKIFALLIGAFISIIFYCISFYKMNPDYFFLVIPLWLLFFIHELFIHSEKSAQHIALISLGVACISLPLGMVHLLVFYDANNWSIQNFGIVLAILLLIWTNDTVAYFTGRWIGKNKLLERISPKKTWEGFFGGIIFSMIAAFFIFKWMHDFDLFTWIGIALIVSVFGTAGDLFQSMMKRQAGVKDSGKILPGHGGLYDRFDAFIFCVPFVFAYLRLLGKI